jgi:type-F conjugative transfer system pilin chaperone TraQ
MKKIRWPSLPALDNTGQGWLALGIWFHIFSCLVIPRPEMAVMLSNLIATVMVVGGGYRILDVWLHRVDAAEREKLAAAAEQAQQQEDKNA